MTLRTSMRDLEAIKTTKAKYFYYLDHKDWDGWRNRVFVSDCSMAPIDPNAGPVVGIEKVIRMISDALAESVTVHHGHMPDIQFSSKDEATGVWAMEDLIYWPKSQPYLGQFTYLHGFGHYHETYVRTAAGWRIKTTKLTRLHVELSSREFLQA